MEKNQYQQTNSENAKKQNYVAPNFRYLSQNVGMLDVLAQASNEKSGNFESDWFPG